MNNNVVFIIPAFNEAGTIVEVVKKVKRKGGVIVVDDGSIDGTYDKAKEAGAYVVAHEVNMGYESALSSGIQAAVALDYAYAITLDADGQHNPDSLDVFVEALMSGSDIVIGVRDKFQRVSEQVFSVVCKALWGIQDPLCGLKGYRVSMLAELEPFDTKKLIGTEMSVKAIRSGRAFTEIDIVTRNRDGVPRFGTGYKANLKILGALSKLVWMYGPIRLKGN